MGLLDNFGEFVKTPEGQGLLSAAFGGMAGARKNQPWNTLGIAGLSGVNGFTSAIENQAQSQYRTAQTEQIARTAAAQKARQDAQARFRGSLSPDQQNTFDASPDEFIKTLPAFQKPQLVETADPKEPLRTQKMWLRPGETEGPIAGVGAMPEMLDPRIQAAKQNIAAAGRAQQSTNVNMPPLEREEQKALGKELAEQYAAIQKAGISATGSVNNLTRMKSLLSGIETGKLTPATTEVSGVLDSLGIKVDAKLPQKQAAAALSNELALRAKNQGGENLMPGAMSDPDRRFLTEMVPSMANTPGGNAIILETLTRKAMRDQEVSKMAREYRTKNKTLDGFSEELSAWSAKNPLFSDLQKSAPQQTDLQSAAAAELARRGRK